MKHHSGDYYVKAAKAHGLEVEHGKGDHVKIKAPAGRGYMIVPMHRELCNGTEYAIKKWFKALGILLVLVLAIIAIIH